MASHAEASAAPPQRVTIERSAAVQELLAQFRPQLRERMPARELRAEAIVAGTFLAVTLPMALLLPHVRSASAAALLLFVLLYAIASRIEFDVAAGYGTPTQLILIPMLYALPPSSVPLLVAAAWVLGKSPSILGGSRFPDRVLASIANAWHSVGPALIFSLARLVAPDWADWPLLAAALAAQLACDFAASTAREWLRLGRFPRLPLRLLAPVWGTDVCLSPIGFAVAFAATGRPAAAVMALPLGGLLMYFARDRRAHIEATLELTRAYQGTALLLGEVVEADDAYTGSHSRDVVDLAKAVGPMMALDDDQLRRLEFAALLHDVGKIAIPKEIINKPAKLTPEERALIETHTITGEAMLDNVGGLLAEVGKVVRSCHERWDGAGYPDGLAGEAIPVEARIVACCDAFNAMTTDRSYRRALPLELAIEELRANRGSQFDPQVVDCLLKLQEEADATARRLADSTACVSVSRS